MTGREVIQEIMAEKGVTNVWLAEQMGVTPATMWARLNYQSVKDVPLDVFCGALKALGYEMVLRPVQQGGGDRVVEIEAPVKRDGRGRPKKVPTPGLVAEELSEKV